MLRILLRIAVAAIALVLLVRRIDVTEVRDALVATPPSAIIVATIAAFVANYVIAFRLQALLATQGVVVRAYQTMAINLAAFFYNLFLPVGGVGVAAIRLQRLSHQTTGRFTAALTAMVCDRLAAVASLGLVGLACWQVDSHAKPAGALVVLLGGVAAIAILVAPRAVPGQVRHFVRELQIGGSGTVWAAMLRRLSHALGSVARLTPGTLVRLVVISVLAQMPGILVYTSLADGLHMSVPFLSMGWIRSVVVLLTVLPISIGGLGVREGALVFTLHAFGVPASDAIAMSILVFATTILAPGLAGGLIEGWHWLRTPREPRRDV